MTGGIAHDFNNILAVAGAGLTLAEKHADDPAKVRSHLVRVREAVDRGLGLTRQLLAFAKRQEIEVSDENVSVLLRGIEPMLRQAAGSGVTLVLRLTDDLPLCRLDRHAVRGCGSQPPDQRERCDATWRHGPA